MIDLVSSNGMIQAMDKAMTLSSRRLGLIASNLANIDTPGYKTQDFSFQDAFKQAVASQDPRTGMMRTHPRHLLPASGDPLPPSRDPIRSAYERNDGNDVNLDRESILLARTQGTYQLGASFAQTELRRLYQAIREGNK